MAKNPMIAVAGNPNCGKTTLFNLLTGSRQQVGNWPGVTVEYVFGQAALPSGVTVDFVDLPGIYCLSSGSPDEKVARDFILTQKPDMILNIIDASNPERNLYLTMRLLDLGLPVLCVLNMSDLAERKGYRYDLKHFAHHLGVRVVPASLEDKNSKSRIFDDIDSMLASPFIPEYRMEMPDEIDQAISELSDVCASFARESGINPKWLSLALLEEEELKDIFPSLPEEAEEVAQTQIGKIRRILKADPDILIAGWIYGAIDGLLKDTLTRGQSRSSATAALDKIFLHKFLGLPLFLGIMFLLFSATAFLGGTFTGFFEILAGAVFIDGLSSVLNFFSVPPVVTAFLAGGLGSGIQTVAAFIPVIFTMYLMLSVLEDSGYMARAAFLMDRIMLFIGLPGKAFVPMLLGFGCTVPAVLSARTLERPRDRFLTIFLSPFMSCGARLPVYALISAAVFSRYAGFVIFAVYFAGIVAAVLMGLLLKSTLFKGKASHFIMELPPYHRPRPVHILKHTTVRLKAFVIRAGKVIILLVAVLGIFNSFRLTQDGLTVRDVTDKNSFLAQTAGFISPGFVPMGIRKDNWPAVVGILTGILAKESIVGTMNGLYGQSDYKEEKSPFNLVTSFLAALQSIPQGFLDSLPGSVRDSGSRALHAILKDKFTPAAAWAYLIFVLMYFPCVSVVAAMAREMGLSLTLVSVFCLTLLAWLTGVLIFQIGEAHKPEWIIGAFGGLAAMASGLFFYGKTPRIKALSR